jgi:hypothetical protein
MALRWRQPVQHAECALEVGDGLHAGELGSGAVARIA